MGLSFVPFLVARSLYCEVDFVRQPVFAPSFSTELRMRMCGWCNLDKISITSTHADRQAKARTQLSSENNISAE